MSVLFRFSELGHHALCEVIVCEHVSSARTLATRVREREEKERTLPANSSGPCPGLTNSSFGSGPLRANVCQSCLSSARGARGCGLEVGQREEATRAHKSLLPSWVDQPSMLGVDCTLSSLSANLVERASVLVVVEACEVESCSTATPRGGARVAVPVM